MKRGPLCTSQLGSGGPKGGDSPNAMGSITENSGDSMGRPDPVLERDIQPWRSRGLDLEEEQGAALGVPFLKIRGQRI